MHCCCCFCFFSYSKMVGFFGFYCFLFLFFLFFYIRIVPLFEYLSGLHVRRLYILLTHNFISNSKSFSKNACFTGHTMSDLYIWWQWNIHLTFVCREIVLPGYTDVWWIYFVDLYMITAKIYITGLHYYKFVCIYLLNSTSLHCWISILF